LENFSPWTVLTLTEDDAAKQDEMIQGIIAVIRFDTMSSVYPHIAKKHFQIATLLQQISILCTVNHYSKVERLRILIGKYHFWQTTNVNIRHRKLPQSKYQ